MIVSVNGQVTELSHGATVQTVVSDLDLEAGRRGIAVAVDAEVVPRSSWESRLLQDGANVEIVTAIQGG